MVTEGMQTQFAAFALRLILAAWSACAILLVRVAERRVAGLAPPAPWREVSSSAVLIILTPMVSANAPEAAARGIACIALCVVATADARTGYIFDAVTFPAAVLTASIVICGEDAASAALGVLLLVGSFGTVTAASRGAWMGLGDVKAMYALGAAFGPLGSALALFAACVSGLAAAVIGDRGGTRELPFGPHLALGASFALLLGEPLAHRLAGVVP